MEEGLISDHCLEVTVHDCLVLLLLGLWRGSTCCWRKTAHLKVDRKQENEKEREGAGKEKVLISHSPLIWFPPTHPTSWKVPLPLNSTIHWRPSFWLMSLSHMERHNPKIRLRSLYWLLPPLHTRKKICSEFFPVAHPKGKVAKESGPENYRWGQGKKEALYCLLEDTLITQSTDRSPAQWKWRKWEG